MAKHGRYNHPDAEEENFLKGLNQNHTPDAGDFEFAMNGEEQTFIGTPEEFIGTGFNDDMFEETNHDLVSEDDEEIVDTHLDTVFEEEVATEDNAETLDEYYQRQGDYEEIIPNEEPIIIEEQDVTNYEETTPVQVEPVVTEEKIDAVFEGLSKTLAPIENNTPEEEVVMNGALKENEEVVLEDGIYREGEEEFIIIEEEGDASRALTKEEVKGLQATALVTEKELKAKLTGIGESEIVGPIKMVVKAETIIRTIQRVLNANLDALASKSNLIDYKRAKAFIDSLEGISVFHVVNKAGSYASLSETLRLAKEQVMATTPAHNPAQMDAVNKKAELILSAHYGASISVLGNAINSQFALLLGMRFKKDYIPKVKLGAGYEDDKGLLDLLLTPFCDPSVKFTEYVATTNSIGWAIDLGKLFYYVQGEFDAETVIQNIKFSSASLDVAANNATPNGIVYNVIKVKK